MIANYLSYIALCAIINACINPSPISATALMSVAALIQHDCLISSYHCNTYSTETTDSNALSAVFDYDNICKTYVLRLDKPVDRSIALVRKKHMRNNQNLLII